MIVVVRRRLLACHAFACIDVLLGGLYVLTIDLRRAPVLRWIAREGLVWLDD